MLSNKMLVNSAYIKYLEDTLAETIARVEQLNRDYATLQADYDDILLENEELRIKLGLSGG